VKFWDASAIVPLLVAEPAAAAVRELLERDPIMLVWWGTPVECASALARREREGVLPARGAATALERLRIVESGWQEILPTDGVRAMALRLLRVHPLRAADSLQLGAAIVAAEHDPAGLEFVSLDERLSEAASREGFPLVRV
jgi:predicted nucleic acid-binding protein